MTYPELRQYLMGLFDPAQLDAFPGEWGFIAGNRDAITRVGYATNLTPETAQEAIHLGADLVLTHHDAWDFLYGMRERCRAMLQEHGIGHAFFHAPLDAADFGTSASLARRMGGRITARANLYRDAFHCGRVAELDPPLAFAEFAHRLEAVLEEPVRAWRHHDRPIRRVCITTGGGLMTADVAEAVRHHCDAYVTGEKVLYTVQYARFAEIDLFVGSHTFTELLGVESLAQRIGQRYPATDLVRLAEEHLE